MTPKNGLGNFLQTPNIWGGGLKDTLGAGQVNPWMGGARGAGPGMSQGVVNTRPSMPRVPTLGNDMMTMPGPTTGGYPVTTRPSIPRMPTLGNDAISMPSTNHGPLSQPGRYRPINPIPRPR